MCCRNGNAACLACGSRYWRIDPACRACGQFWRLVVKAHSIGICCGSDRGLPVGYILRGIGFNRCLLVLRGFSARLFFKSHAAAGSLMQLSIAR